ncbi:fertilization-influencing membrane protein [Podarcis raffonei]|uniref:fertilization-influencing membrane protein n=1 Tax=Podarcis raffonei TaxID=65483 RepID=UPI00232930F2|nr:fertilization-influencing membrane protein [Podarcis raffonei]
MLSRGQFLLLQLLYTFTNLSELILSSPLLVTGEHRSSSTGPPSTPLIPSSTRAGNPGNATEADLSRHQPLWFDYPDTDEKKILAVYKLIGEQPEYIPPSSFPHQLRYILVGSIILILLFFLYQIISKVIFKKSNAG